MKLGTVQLPEGQERLGVLQDDGGILLAPAGFGDMQFLIEAGDTALRPLRELLRAPGTQRVQLSDVRLLAPIRRFRRDVLCTGWNYWDHFYESEGKREGQDVPKPDAPTFFTKGPDVVIGPNDDISFDPLVSSKWDYEAEIALVIGKAGRSIPIDKAMDHVWGYCLANDVSQRDLQRRHGGQWLKGKSIDGTMPLGPWITLRDDIDITGVTLECELNGKLMQQASASDMAFSIAELVSELSFGMTLRPGDVLLTGTPSGIGNARTPPVYLAEGDLLVVRATGMGELCNRVTRVDLSSYSGG
jgi:2,4-diketo-3-deoxy-L-fuconate hydrolase